MMRGRHTRRSGRRISAGPPEVVARQLDRQAGGLYALIWRRALASQMAAARVERLRIELAGEDGDRGDLPPSVRQRPFDGHRRIREADGVEEGDRKAMRSCQTLRRANA